MNKIRQIGSFAKVRRGASPRPISDPKYFGGTVGWVRIVDVTKHNYKYLRITEQYLSELGQSKSVTVEKGDLIMSICATVGKPIIVDMTACIHDGFVQLYDLDGVDTEYLFYQLQFNESKFERSGQPGTQVNLNTNIVENKQIWLPENLDKQLKIAKILSTIDRTIAKTEALIEKYQQIKAGLMHDLFTRGIGADGKLRSRREEAPELYRESAIGWIPKEWKVKLLDYGLSTSPKNGFSPQEADIWQGIYVLGLGCLTKNGFSPLQLKKAPKNALLSGAKLENGDFLISRSNTQVLVGLCGIYRDVGYDAIYPDLMMKLKPNQNLTAEFLEKYLLSEATRQRISAIAVGTSSSMVKINATNLRSLKVTYPKPNEQIKIVEKLKPIEKQISCLKTQFDKLQKQKSGLMHDLLTGKVSVNVDSDAP